MATQVGVVSVFNHYPNGSMWTGSGERDEMKYVNFPKAFQNPPKVVAAISTLDGTGSSVRVSVSCQDITDHGFNLKVVTWADTKLATVSATWFASDG